MTARVFHCGTRRLAAVAPDMTRADRFLGGLMTRRIWLLAGAVIQFVAAAIGDVIVIAGNLGELALLAGLIVTDARLSDSLEPTRSSRPT